MYCFLEIGTVRFAFVDIFIYGCVGTAENANLKTMVAWLYAEQGEDLCMVMLSD
jgi:hypothetical protein